MVEKPLVVTDVKSSRRAEVKSGCIVVAGASGCRAAPLRRQGERAVNVASVVDTIPKGDTSGLSNSVCSRECDHVT